MLQGATIGTLEMFGGQFINPTDVAVSGTGAVISGGAFIGAVHEELGSVEVEGTLDFSGAQIKPFLMISHVHFDGPSTTKHGFFGAGMTIDGALLLHEIEYKNGASLDLSAAKVSILVDEPRYWPPVGKLILDAFEYRTLAPPVDSDSRLRWLALQPPGYHPQPYRQLARVLRESGDESGATKVMIASGDARYSQYRAFGRAVGWALKVTIGYGHRPLLAIVWSIAVVVFGWVVIFIAKAAGVMRQTWPENSSPPPAGPEESLHPLLYSLDVFLPFVNLHQENYWWPDANAIGQGSILGMTYRCRGWIVRSYLWTQIIAGWLLSAIFVAGVTGLIRND